MFEFLKRKKSAHPLPRETGTMPFYFKSGEAALRMACEYMECPLSKGSSLPALVLDAREAFGADEAVKVEPSGVQLAMLRIASPDGGFLAVSKTITANGPRLLPGQLVSWRAIEYSPEVARAGANDKRFGWVGVITATLKPHFVNGSWVGDEQFLP